MLEMSLQKGSRSQSQTRAGGETRELYGNYLRAPSHALL